MVILFSVRREVINEKLLFRFIFFLQREYSIDDKPIVL